MRWETSRWEWGVWGRGLPDVVVPAEDHAALGVAGGAHLPQLGLAAGALEAAAVPVAVHGVEQEAVGDLPSAARAPLPRQGARPRRGGLPAAARVHHGAWGGEGTRQRGEEPQGGGPWSDHRVGALSGPVRLSVRVLLLLLLVQPHSELHVSFISCSVSSSV